MIQQERVSFLNDCPARKRRFVLYWMQASQRTQYNHALEWAILKANELRQPLVVFFGLTDSYPEANLRHYHFMLEGLREVEASLVRRGILMVVQRCSPDDGVSALAADASCVVVDAGATRLQRRWRRSVAEKTDCSLIQVETDVVVPVTVTSSKEEYSAATIRPKIHRHLARYLVPLRTQRLREKSLHLSIPSLALDSPDALISSLSLDRSVCKAAYLRGGTTQALRHLTRFLTDKLAAYPTLKDDPGKDCVSHLSAYLHFGQISPLQIALKAREAEGPGTEAFLEELIVRRELAINFVTWNQRYDSYESLPSWARDTLQAHQSDPRENLYSLEQLEQARTSDPCWNACQREMMLTGTMHGYMRMYWGKKIIEWTQDPEEAYRRAILLNNKYELDGRDPNGYAGIAWCFGKHDRPWPQRPIFGMVRSMTSQGLKRKFDIDLYVEKIKRLKIDIDP